jgi:hypothetical protein
MAAPSGNSSRKGRLGPGKEIIAGLGGFLLMVVALFFTPYFLLVDRRRGSRLRNEYRAMERLLDWSDLQSLAKARSGILLVELNSPGYLGRSWWVEGNELNISNCPLPIVGQISIPDAMEATFSFDAAKLWCIKNLSRVADKASLVDVEPRALAKLSPKMIPARMINASLWRKIQRELH